MTAVTDSFPGCPKRTANDVVEVRAATACASRRSTRKTTEPRGITEVNQTGVVDLHYTHAGMPESLERIVSSERFAPFVTACDGDRERAVALYEWTGKVAGAFWTEFRVLEIAYRNRID